MNTAVAVGERPQELAMRIAGAVLRAFAFIFNFLLALGLFLLALLVISGGQHNIELSPVPLTGSRLTYAILIASIAAFVAIVLALRKSRAARIPMLVWNILVSALLCSTPFRGSFSFENDDHLKTGVTFFAVSLAALLGSWLQSRKAVGSKR